jgi:hypothetical protein
MEPKPPGDNWQKGFSLTIAYGPDCAAVWEQWGGGAWIGFTDLYMALLEAAKSHGIDVMPLVIPGRPVPKKFARGPSLIPVFTIERLLPPPECLLQLAQANMEATKGMIAAPAPVQPAPAAAPARAAVQAAGWGAPAVQLAASAAPSAPAAVVAQPVVKPIGWGPAPEPPAQQPEDPGLIDDAPPF